MAVNPRLHEAFALEGLVTHNPVLASVTPYLQEVSVFLVSETSVSIPGEESTTFLPTRPFRRRIAPRLNKVEGEALGVTAGLALSQPEGTDIAEYVRGLAQPHLKDMPQGGELVDGYVADVLCAIEARRILSALTDKIVPPIQEAVDSDLTGQYEFTKLLATDRRTLSAEEAANLNALQAVLSFERMDKGDDTDTLPRRLESQLEQGGFDELIAQELLHEAIQGTADNRQQAQAYQELNKLVSLVKLVSNADEAQAITLLSKPGSIELWGTGCRQSFETAKTGIIKGLRANFSRFERKFREDGVDISGAAEEAHGIAMQIMTAAFRRQSGQALSPRELIANERQRSLQPSTRRQRDTGRVATSAAEVKLAEGPKPKELAYITPSGEVVPEEYGAHKVCVDKYLKTHQGQPGLKEDVDNALQHLRDIDFSKGPVRGLKKYQQSFKRGGKEFDLFALKLSDAVGLSTSSKVAKKIRVFFTLTGGKIGLVGIVDRADVPRFEKHLGIVSGSGTKS